MDWRARWTGDGGSIDLAMTLLDDNVDPPSFGGFNVTADCAHELFELGLAIRGDFRQVCYTRPIAASRSQNPLFNSSEVRLQ